MLIGTVWRKCARLGTLHRRERPLRLTVGKTGPDIPRSPGMRHTMPHECGPGPEDPTKDAAGSSLMLFTICLVVGKSGSVPEWSRPLARDHSRTQTPENLSALEPRGVTLAQSPLRRAYRATPQLSKRMLIQSEMEVF